MLDTDGVTDYLATVRAFADTTGQRANLETMLDRLGKFFDVEGDGAGRTTLYKDFAPYSFGFEIERKSRDGGTPVAWVHMMTGGLIYHGKHDGGGNGGAPTYSVSLSPADGWSIHT